MKVIFIIIHNLLHIQKLDHHLLIPCYQQEVQRY